MGKLKSTFIAIIFVLILCAIPLAIPTSAAAETFFDPITGSLITPHKVTENGMVEISEEEYLRDLEMYPREEIIESNESNVSDSGYTTMDSYREYWRYTPTTKTVVTGKRKKVSADIECTTNTCNVGKGINTTVSHSFNVSATAEKDAIKAGAGYTWVSSAGQINTYGFNLVKGERGFIAFDPRYNKTTGTLKKYSNWDGNNVLASKEGIGYSVKKVGEEADGTYLFVHIGWFNKDGIWYYANTAGVKQTGWQSIGGTWYYFNSSGAMQKGWQSIGGTWYYFNSSGAMQTGWQSIGGTWYYLNSSGAMQTGWQSIGGTWYYLNTSGAMQTGWQSLGGTWYYLNTSGAMQTGWQYIDGGWYYFYSNGGMAYNTTIDGYKLGSNGKML